MVGIFEFLSKEIDRVGIIAVFMFVLAVFVLLLVVVMSVAGLVYGVLYDPTTRMIVGFVGGVVLMICAPPAIVVFMAKRFGSES